MCLLVKVEKYMFLLYFAAEHLKSQGQSGNSYFIEHIDTCLGLRCYKPYTIRYREMVDADIFHMHWYHCVCLIYSRGANISSSVCIMNGALQT